VNAHEAAEQKNERFPLNMNKHSYRARLYYWPLIIIFSFVSLPSFAEDKLTMNMRDADIRSLIQWVADNTGKNIVVHKNVKGKVTVLSSKPLTPDEAYEVFLSVLQVHGFAAIETDQALKIVPRSIAAGSGLPFSGASSDMVVNLIHVENISATKLSQVLRPLVSKEAVLVPFSDTSSILIADHASNIKTIKRLIAQLDNAGDNEIEIVKLTYANAADVLASIKSLLSSGGNVDTSLTLSADERSNSILMAGDPARRKKIKKLILQLDEPLMGDGNTQVIYLHYVDAAEIEPILKNLAESIQKQKKEDSSGISIESSESANALIINAPPAVLTTMKRIISQLDIRRAQVMIEALIVEVSGDVADDIGVTWLSTDITDLDDNDVVTAANTLGDLPLTGGPRVGIDPDTGDPVILPFSAGQGLTFGYFTSGNIQAAIRALSTTKNVNILSTPTIVAIDNEEASLLVGQNVPFKTGQETSSSSDTSNPFVTIERQDIGISLVVTPRINQGDSITLEILQKAESIEPDVNVASDIVTSKREIKTVALIKDGQTLVLGGLISDKETEVVSKVPFLGDIPFIGWLFRSTGKSHEKTNLMVFIRPVILKDEEHIAAVTQKRYDFMSKQQNKVLNEEWDLSMDKKPKLEEFETFTPVEAE
jgi:general secretion pathway protein D